MFQGDSKVSKFDLKKVLFVTFYIKTSLKYINCFLMTYTFARKETTIIATNTCHLFSVGNTIFNSTLCRDPYLNQSKFKL